VDDPAGVLPIAVLVVGGEDIAEALTEDSTLRARAFECERTDDAESALELARAYAPDVVIVDADVKHASELVEALLDDPLTEPVPIVVVGTFRTPDELARYVALGVAKALPKPVVPDALRRTCDEILDAREGRTMRVTLGEPTLEQLAERLAEELRRALVDSVDRPARSCRVPLGEGTEVLGALWGAIARVQEIVSQRTGGAVRFGGDAPEGAIALAPWLHQDLPASERAQPRGRGAAADVRLAGRRVVVADDDPGVTWFISDLLRTAGCEVHEALDGVTALELSFRVQPELVVSDILMPGMDGFALSRALHRDVALRDVPVILLSWKEDLLQRVRELGASAAAYMKKESDSRAILARVREVLRPRARIEMRLRGEGEVRGRLDGLTTRLLLELVGAVRRDARVAVRDASYLYEIEIRGGEPRKATRTSSDGGFVRGERALAALLGVGAGRFVVSSSAEPVRGELTGTLFEQLAGPLAAARGALAATTGPRTMNVERIVLDDAMLEDALRATPDPAKALIRRIASGVSPRQMVLAGEVAPSLVEDVLADLAARGAVRGVLGAHGVDLLTPAVEAALAVLRVSPKPPRSLPPNARPSVPGVPIGVVRLRSAQVPVGRAAPAATTEAARERPVEARARPPTPSPMPAVPAAPTSAPIAPTPLRVSSKPPAASKGDSSKPPPPTSNRTDSNAPSSLEDAVMRELSDRSPDPGGVRESASQPPPIVEPSELRPRSSNPPPDSSAPESVDERALLPSIPPDAIVPDTTSDELPVSTRAPASVPPAGLPLLPPPARSPLPPVAPAEPLGAGEAPAENEFDDAWDAGEVAPEHEAEAVGALRLQPAAAPVELPSEGEPPAAFVALAAGSPLPEPEAAPEPAHDTQAEAPYASPFAMATLPLPLGASPAAAPPPALERTLPLAPPPARAPRRRSAWPLLGAFALLGLAIGAVLHLSGGSATSEAPATPTIASPSAAAPLATITAGTASVATQAPTSAAPSASGDALPMGVDVPDGYGLIEVAGQSGARVRIDGAIAGAGTQVRLVAAPGYHDVRVEHEGAEAREVVQVRPGKTTRVTSAPAP
jgi:DNA-binding response OmpR family regulator